ncbi:MAG: FHA domain-containing protein [Anaerolineae bacterium]
MLTHFGEVISRPQAEKSLTKYLLILLVFTFILPVAQAQSLAADVAITHLTATALDNGEVRVSALVSALDETGQPVAGLTAADFTVQENGVRIDPQALTVAPATQPLTLTLLIDTSSGVGRPGPGGVALDSVRAAAAALVERLKPDDRIAVYEYNAEARAQLDFTYDHNLAIDQGIFKLAPSESNAACLYDALSTLLQNQTGQAQERRLVLVITGSPDGGSDQNCSGATADDVIKTATVIGKATPIFTVGFGSRVEADELLRVSQRTGGQSLVEADAAKLTDVLVKVANQLQGQYEISYATTASNLASLKISENGSGLADDRQLLIPAAIPPTPTPLPQFAITLQIEQTGEGRLQIKIDAPPDVTLTKTELFVDNESEQKAISPPYDQFYLDISRLSPGPHKLRVEATDTNQVMAVDEREVIVPTPTPPPTPVPPTPVPSPTPAPEQGLFSGAGQTLPLLLIIVGLVILLALLGLIVYLLFFYAKQPAVALPVSPPPPPINPMITIDEEPAVISRPPRGSGAAREAKLLVLSGHEAFDQPEFKLQQAETRLGRNTAKEAFNDIAVQDKEVSRSHAKIIRREQGFFIQDLNSSSGTFVNRIKVSPTNDILLESGVEIMIGPNVKLRFELIAPRSIDETLDEFISLDGLRTQDDTEDPDHTFYSKTKK